MNNADCDDVDLGTLGRKPFASTEDSHRSMTLEAIIESESLPSDNHSDGRNNSMDIAHGNACSGHRLVATDAESQSGVPILSNSSSNETRCTNEEMDLGEFRFSGSPENDGHESDVSKADDSPAATAVSEKLTKRRRRRSSFLIPFFNRRNSFTVSYFKPSLSSLRQKLKRHNNSEDESSQIHRNSEQEVVEIPEDLSCKDDKQKLVIVRKSVFWVKQGLSKVKRLLKETLLDLKSFVW